MPYSFNKLWIHAIWSTKDQLPFIEPSGEKKVYEFMSSQFTESGCPVRIINRMPDHVHCLFPLKPQKAITEIIKQVKEISSHRITCASILSIKNNIIRKITFPGLTV